MKVQQVRSVFTLALALGAATPVAAQMNRCVQPDGTTMIQQLPCDPAPLRPAPAARPAGERSVAGPVAPAPATVAPEPQSTPPAAANTTAEPAGRPTRRQREVLERTARLDRCRGASPAFRERSQAVYEAWKLRHAAVFAVHGAPYAGGRVPPNHCSEEFLHETEQLAQAPDPRFATVGQTWERFLGALRAGDRVTALSCLAGNAEIRWRARIDRYSDDDLRRLGTQVRTFRIQWGDDYEKEALAQGDDAQVSSVTFVNRNEEWKISDFAPAAGGPALPVTTRKSSPDS